MCKEYSFNPVNWIELFKKNFFFLKLVLSSLWASQVSRVVKNLPANAGDTRDMDLIPESGDPLE